MNNKMNKNNINRQVSKDIRGKEKSQMKIPFQIFTEPMKTGIETKYKDTSITYGSIPNTGLVTAFSNPQQGNSSVQRIADRCFVQDLEISATWQLSTVGLPDVVRWIVFQEVGASVAPPAITDILQTASPIAPFLYNVRELYHIIHDELIPMSPGSDTGSVVRRFGLKLREPDFRFVAGTTNLYSGQIFSIQITFNSGNIVGSQENRLWFCDRN